MSHNIVKFLGEDITFRWGIKHKQGLEGGWGGILIYELNDAGEIVTVVGGDGPSPIPSNGIIFDASGPVNSLWTLERRVQASFQLVASYQFGPLIEMDVVAEHLFKMTVLDQE